MRPPQYLGETHQGRRRQYPAGNPRDRGARCDGAAQWRQRYGPIQVMKRAADIAGRKRAGAARVGAFEQSAGGPRLAFAIRMLGWPTT